MLIRQKCIKSILITQGQIMRHHQADLYYVYIELKQENE